MFFGSIGGTRWPPVIWLIHFGIPMGTNCAPLLADIFMCSYEAEFIQSLLSTGRKQLASQFNFTYRNIDDVLSINNPDFEKYLSQMYPPKLEIKDTTESNTSASYRCTWIYSCQSVGTVNFTLPFTTSVTILISTSQTFRSWAATSHRLRSSLRKFYGRYGDLIKQYEVPLSWMLHGILDDDHLQWHPPLIRHYTNFDNINDLDLITKFDFLPNCKRFP